MEAYREGDPGDGGQATVVATEPTSPTRCGSCFPAALLAVGPAIPIVAAVCTVFVYAAREHPLWDWLKAAPLLAGTGIALAIWAVSALACRPFTTADQANARSFGELCERLERLRVRLKLLQTGGVADRLTDSMEIARDEAAAHCRVIERELGRSGLQWVTGAGYLNLWNRLHRAEEALINAEPTEDVIGGALYDELRLENSEIQTEAQLLNKLRRALVTLSPGSAIYLNQQPPQPPPSLATARVDRDGVAGQALPASAGAGGTRARGTASASAAGRVPAAVAATGTGTDGDAVAAEPGGPGDPRHEHGADAEGPAAALDPRKRRAEVREARAVLREIRRGLNEFRDDRWDGLVRARNRILGTLTVTGIVTYVLLGFALEARSANAPLDRMQDAIVAATAFYLVGAIVGLFDRLNRESKDDAAVEDYGLSNARLALTPILSGLAAVGGVLITTMLLGTVNGSALTPQVSAAPASPAPARVAALTPSLGATLAAQQPAPTPAPAAGPSRPGDIFNLEKYPFGLILAAIFGFTPGLLINRLKQGSQRMEADLRRTEPQQSGGSPKGVEAQPAPA